MVLVGDVYLKCSIAGVDQISIWRLTKFVWKRKDPLAKKAYLSRRYNRQCSLVNNFVHIDAGIERSSFSRAIA